MQETIDTTTSVGKLVLHIFSALAELERDIIRERTHAGLSAARACGKSGGKPKAMDAKKINMAKALYKDKENSIASICQTLKVSRTTFYKYLTF